MKKNMHRIKDLLAGALVAVLVMGMAVPAMAAEGSKTAKLVYDNIKLVINGKTIALKDSKGKAIEPFTIDGTTYLPVRAVGEALGMDVDWNGKTKTVTLTGETGTTSNPGDIDDSDYIGVEKAKKIALKHADVKASDAVFFKARLDWDDGRAEYEIEFYSKNTEYDYDIDALTGEIRSWDREAEGYSIPSSNDSNSSRNYIGVEKAKSLAQKKAPNAALVSIELDYDDGRAIYEGTLRDGRTEYEFEIDAASGSFVKWEMDYDD